MSCFNRRFGFHFENPLNFRLAIQTAPSISQNFLEAWSGLRGEFYGETDSADEEWAFRSNPEQAGAHE